MTANFTITMHSENFKNASIGFAPLELNIGTKKAI